MNGLRVLTWWSLGCVEILEVLGSRRLSRRPELQEEVPHPYSHGVLGAGRGAAGHPLAAVPGAASPPLNLQRFFVATRLQCGSAPSLSRGGTAETKRRLPSGPSHPVRICLLPGPWIGEAFPVNRVPTRPGGMRRE